GVAGAVRAAGRVDAGDPKLAEVTLAQLATDVRVLPRLPQHVERLAVAIGTATEKAFGLLQDALVTTVGAGTTLDSGHRRSSRSAVGKKEFDAALHRFVDHVLVAQAAAAGSGLPNHVVLRAAFGATDAPAAAHFEALRSGSIGLHFRHDRLSPETWLQTGGLEIEALVARGAGLMTEARLFVKELAYSGGRHILYLCTWSSVPV